MKISILLPVYNTAKYLPDCLNSILAQTEHNWELLAIDDFSRDNSFEILKSYAQKDDRIQVFKNTQKGIIPALRLAFEKSTGDLITRMDSDDKMTPDKLAILKSLLQKHGKGHLATGFVKYFSDEGLKEGYQNYEKWLNNLTKEGNNFREIYKECVIPSPCWMVFREDLIRCGAFDSPKYPEDYDLCFRFYKNKLKVVASTTILHHWRDYDTRTSRTSETYSNNQYFDLKLPYFLELDYNNQRPLVLWGAGRKGKKLARMLSENEIPFHWVCNNPKKWGIKLYKVPLESFENIPKYKNPQIIVGVAAPSGVKEILAFFEKNRLEQKKHYFFF